MKTYEERELKVLDKIAETLVKLEGTLDKLDTADSHLSHFVQQEKAIHEIKVILRRADKIDELEEDRIGGEMDAVEYDEELAGEQADKVAKELNKLDLALAKLDDTDSRVKGYIEQKKALHAIKKLLHAQGKYDAYREDELEHLDDLA